MQKKVLKALTDRGTLVQTDALEYIMGQPDPMAFVNRLLSKEDDVPLSMSLEWVMERALAEGIDDGAVQTLKDGGVTGDVVGVQASIPRDGTDGSTFEIKVIKDVTGKSTCEGEAREYQVLLRSRLNSLRGELLKRPPLSGYVSMDSLPPPGRRAAVVGLVEDIRVSRKGHRILVLEDETGSVSVLIPSDRSSASSLFMADEVVGVVGRVGDDRNRMVANEVIFPEPQPADGTVRGQGSIVMVGDLHWGDAAFQREGWDQLIQHVTNRSGIDDIRALLMLGDLVDTDALLTSADASSGGDPIQDAYSALGQSLQGLPDKVIPIVIPGEKDAVRITQPQPAIAKRLQQGFPDRSMFLGNPSWLEVGGISMLAYHGVGCELYAKRMDPSGKTRANNILKEMVRKRHLCPSMTRDTPLAPESTDMMIIDPLPRVMVTAHLHWGAVGNFRNVMLVNLPPVVPSRLPLSIQGESSSPGTGFILHLDTMEISPFP